MEKLLKKVFLIISVIVLGIFLSLGCVTKQVWKDPKKAFSYAETIISFYNNVEKEEILFIGKKYHYIFTENTKYLIELLKQREFLELVKRKLSVEARIDSYDNRKTFAHIEIQFKESELSKTQKNWLIHSAENNGRRDSRPMQYHEGIYRVYFNIRGTRYHAKSEVNTQVAKLKNSIPLNITEYKVEKKSTLYKVAMTPLSVTADAGLAVVVAGALIVYSPFALGNWIIESVTK